MTRDKYLIAIKPV